ncbi:MAG TPA: 6-phosphogluconolactonase [Methylomirabilota bacterium]|nr:6-phosphogluconolactonase [Methylomirabilota bacterium]
MSQIRRLEDPAAVAAAAARDFADLAREAIRARGRFSVALSGGSTPRRLYALLAEHPFREAVPWDRIDVFWGDERAVPPDHPDSNYGAARAALLSKVPVPRERVHRVLAEVSDPREAARRYQAEIARVFGVPEEGAPPAFDLVLLGMGADGHTASLFPYSEALVERRRWVVSHYVSQLGAARITFTVPLINGAREIRVLVTGADKAATLESVLEGPREPERLPAQLVAPVSGRTVWLVDEAAAAKLLPAGEARD